MADEAPEKDKRRRAIMMAGAIAAVAALGAAAYVLLGAGSPATPAGSAAGKPLGSTTRPTASHAASASSSPSMLSVPIASQEPHRADPFRPLFTPKPTPTPTGTPTGTASAGAGQTAVPAGGTVGGLPSGSASAAQDVVALISISGGKEPTVSVMLDGKNITGKALDVVGSILRVVSIRPTDGSATFQLGDATFDLHIGQTYTN
jgi:hypothetical protein